jgi:hypothetical protein
MKETTKPLRLQNRTCVYCGRHFGGNTPRTREHVIGRNFVPKGSFKSNDWNLVVWACEPCNHEKADLEGEISAITLQPSIGAAHLDEKLSSLAERKASKTRSHATGKTVLKSRETFEHTYSFTSNVSMTFSFIGPPRLVRNRVMAMAGAQLQAFFYFLTYNESQRTGSFIPGGISWFTFTQKADWGNVQFLAFATLTRDWNGRIRGSAADNYFRIVIKRDPSGIEVWSFALEWNQNYRIIGFFGDANSAAKHASELPSFEWVRLDGTTRTREETPLKSSEDILFACLFTD